MIYQKCPHTVKKPTSIYYNSHTHTKDICVSLSEKERKKRREKFLLNRKLLCQLLCVFVTHISLSLSLSVLKHRLCNILHVEIIVMRTKGFSFSHAQ